jgi:cytochrome c biogenesis protein CcmG/thiol:disulfide interchange protein DsbE
VKRLLRPAPLVVIAATIALVSLLAYGLASSRSDATLDDALARGERPAAPAFSLPPLTGDQADRKSLADFKGKVVVLNVWASWCVPCRVESPLLERWHRKISSQNGTVLGVNTQDIDSDARRFIDRYGLTFPQLRDKEGDDMRSDFGAIAYPETFVIDRQGRVAALVRGEVDDAWMRKHVEPLLAEGT